MKTALVFVFLAVLSFSQADLNAEKLLVTLEELPLYLHKFKEELPLKVVLGHPDAEGLDLVEKKVKQLIGQHVRKYFENFLIKIQNLGYQTEESLEKLAHLLKDKPTTENAEKFISEFLEIENEQEMFLQILEEIFRNQNSLKEATLYSRDSRGLGLGDTLDRIIAWFGGLGSWISDSMGEFKDWAKDIFIKTMDTASPITDQIKILAQDFLASNWDKLSVKIVSQALSFFHPYAGILGGKIVEQILNLAKNKHVTSWSDITVPSVNF
uniref:Vitellogenin domain-containing protein n=1 Tax=Strigamia maritima TaxID=126957 RepID=T1IN53_STRMM